MSPVLCPKFKISIEFDPQRRRKRPNLKRDRSSVSRMCHLCGFPARTDVDLAAHGRELHGGERMFRSVRQGALEEICKGGQSGCAPWLG